MKYNGIELNEFTSNESVVFDPPKTMLVWDKDYDTPDKVEVVAYLPSIAKYPVVTLPSSNFAHCAEIPESAKPRRATNRELSKWLAQGNGESYDNRFDVVDHEYTYHTFEMDGSCQPTLKIRKWDDEEWHEPTLDYMGLEE